MAIGLARNIASQKNSGYSRVELQLRSATSKTYRFSEDLDFSLLPDARYSQEELTQDLSRLVQVAGELSGIVFPADLVQVRERRNLQGGTTYEGKISYRGPLANPTPTPPRVLFDITHHEPFQDEPEERSILHPYPDPDSRKQHPLVYSLFMNSSPKRRARFTNAATAARLIRRGLSS